MKHKTLNKIVTITIYFLTSILTILILYNIILIFGKNSPNTPSPRNSIKVSPISGEKVYNVSNMKAIYKVNYKNVPLNKLSSLSKASIIYDTYNESNNSNSYSALFLGDDFTREDSMLTISSTLTEELPNITFINNSDLKDYSYIKSIDSIILTNNLNSYSNFFYYDGEYHHFTKSLEDTDPISNKQITYQNVIIDTNDQGNILYVYSGGLFRNYIKGDNLFLSKGRTYWCTLNKNSLLNFTFSDLDEKMNNLITKK